MAERAYMAACVNRLFLLDELVWALEGLMADGPVIALFAVLLRLT